MPVNQLFPQFLSGKGCGGFEALFGKGGGQAGLGKIEDAHGSTAEGGHGSGRFVSPGELVVLRLIGQCLAEKLGRFGGALAHRFTKVDLAVSPKAGPDFSVGGEAQLVARGAKVGRGEGSDEAEDGAGVWIVKIAGGTVPRPVVGEESQG